MIRVIPLLLFLSILSAANAQPDTRLSSREYDVLFHEAMLQRQKGHHDACFDLLSRCIELRPDAAEVFFFQAQYFNEMNLPDSALYGYRRAAELCPDNATYLETLAQAYINKSDYQHAISVVEKLYTSDKSRTELLDVLYRLYVKESEFENAIDVLNRMETVDGKTERTALSKSSLLIQMERKEEAIAEVKALSDR